MARDGARTTGLTPRPLEAARPPPQGQACAWPGRIEWGSALSSSFALTCMTGGNLPGCICPCFTNGLVKGVLWPDKKGSRWAQAKGKGSGQHAGCINEAISPLFCFFPLFFILTYAFFLYVCVFIPTFRREKGL